MRIRSGEDYERAMCRKLRRYGFRKIRATAASGDHGTDILAVRKGISYAIQCKYYSYPVGNHAVQEAYTGCAYYGCDVPAVLTNSTFTANARREAERIGVELWQENRIPFHRQSVFDFIIFALPGIVFTPLAKWLFNPLTAHIFCGIYFGVWTLFLIRSFAERFRQS